MSSVTRTFPNTASSTWGEIAEEEVTSMKTFSNVSKTAEILDASEMVDGAIGGGVSYTLYRILKEFLTLEGARQRGEISNGEVVKRVGKVAVEAAKTGIVVGAIFGIAVMIFGSWLLVPLSIIAPFAGIKMTYDLWDVFWNGLNEQQRQELIEKANEVGGQISAFFNDLEQASHTN